MKKFIPLLILPVILLAGCTTEVPEPEPTQTSDGGNVINEEVEDNGTYFPAYNPISTDEVRWEEQYGQYGALLPEESPEPRTLTAEEFNSYTNQEDTLRVQGEVTADAELTAANVTAWLVENPTTSETLTPPNELLINRYPELVTYQFSKIFGDENWEVYLNPSMNNGAGVGGYAQTTL